MKAFEPLKGHTIYAEMDSSVDTDALRSYASRLVEKVQSQARELQSMVSYNSKHVLHISIRQAIFLLRPYKRYNFKRLKKVF